MKLWSPTTEYIGSGEYVGDMVPDEHGNWVNYDDIFILLSEAIETMINLSPRVKDFDGCFGRMAGGVGGEDCDCTVCKIRCLLNQGIST
jgi:hypothetical protein